jgi:hypothetical protein
MAQFLCTCGHRISLVIAPSPLEASLFSDQKQEALQDAVCKAVLSLVRALQESRRAEYVNALYGQEMEIDDESLIFDTISYAEHPFLRRVHQCDACGRIWLQRKPDGNYYVAFSPDGEWRGILAE